MINIEKLELIGYQSSIKKGFDILKHGIHDQSSHGRRGGGSNKSDFASGVTGKGTDKYPKNEKDFLLVARNIAGVFGGKIPSDEYTYRDAIQREITVNIKNKQQDVIDKLTKDGWKSKGDSLTRNFKSGFYTTYAQSVKDGTKIHIKSE